MSRFRQSLATAFQAAKFNFLPGLLLQSVLALFLVAYLTHDGTREVLGNVAELKQQSGFSFTFVSFFFAGGVLPELLRIGFFQKCRVTRLNLWNAATGGIIWGGMGILVDLLYRGQSIWFGNESNFQTIFLKVLVDQLIYSPFIANPLAVGLLTWRNARFAPNELRKMLCGSFYLDNVLPIQVAGWCVWIPAVSLVYFMPPALQVPIAVLIQAFWVLLLTTINERQRV